MTACAAQPVVLLPSPWVILVDSAEQLPFAFDGPYRHGKQVYAIRTAPGKLFIRDTMLSVDYSLLGHTDQVGIERKSMADFFGTMGQGRARFERKLELLATYDYAAVVVEAEWGAMFTAPPRHSRLNPKTAFCSVLAWTQRFPRVHWFFLPNRAVAEATTVLLLDRWWRDHQQEVQS